MRKIKLIVLHCSDTPEGREHDADDIRRWHVNGNGWSDIGYHYVIKLDGTVEKGREDSVSGAHAGGNNKNSIGICYIGGKDKDTGKPKDTRTEEQTCELENLIRVLLDKYPEAQVLGHNELSSKACPSFDVQEWLKEIKL